MRLKHSLRQEYDVGMTKHRAQLNRKFSAIPRTGGL
jgi:hypothetical protein